MNDKKRMSPTHAICTGLIVVLSAGRLHAQDRDLIDVREPGIVQKVQRDAALRNVLRDPLIAAVRSEDREKLESALLGRIKNIERVTPISDAQKKKLMLAGRADIERHLQRLHEIQLKLTGAQIEEPEGFQRLDDLGPLNIPSKRELFAERSLFHKVMLKTLDGEQLQKLEDVARRRAIDGHKAIIQWVLGTWDQSLKWDARQRRKVEAFLHDHTRPAQKQGEYDYYGLLLQLSRLPEDQLKAQFAADQWVVLAPQIAEARKLELTLKDGGYLPKENVAAGLDRPRRDPEKVQKKRG